MKDFEDDLCISVFKNDDFILEIIVLYSIVFYTQSTEKRQIAFKEETLMYEGNNNKNHNELMKDIQFQQMFKKNDNFLQSEFFHNISTSILIKYTEDSLLLGQLIENYKKYYSKVFKIITEEEESQTQSHLINSGTKLKEKQKFLNEL